MKCYLLLNGKRIRCLYNYTNLIVLFDSYADWKSINNTWVTIISYGKNEKMVFEDCCYVAINNSLHFNTDFSRYFDVLYHYDNIKKPIRKIEIKAYGFNTFFNLKKGGRHRPLVGRPIYNQSIVIGEKTYCLTVINDYIASDPSDYINQAKIITSCCIEAETINVEDIIKIIKYFKNMLQFITINSTKRIERIVLFFDDEETILFANDKVLHNYNEKETFFLVFWNFKNRKQFLFDFINNYFERPYNIFFDKTIGFHESQIPAVIGEFEGVFDRCAKKSKRLKQLIVKNKNKIHFDEILLSLKSFKKNHRISDKNYSNFMAFINTYSFSCKEKIEYVFNEMIKCLNLIPYDFGFIKTAVGFAEQQIGVRNRISHGRKRNDQETIKSVYTIDLFQELIYFMVIKYIIGCSNKMTANILSCYYFSSMNSEMSLLKNKKSQGTK